MKATAEAVEEAVGGLSFSSEFLLFILDSRMHYHLNLDLAYYLSHAQSIHLREAARLFDTTRGVLLDQVLASNPAFERRTIRGLRGTEGGHRRDIILTAKARDLIEELQAIAVLRRGGDRCAELRRFAEAARKEARISEDDFSEWLKDKRQLWAEATTRSRATSRLLQGMAEAGTKYGKTTEELKAMIAEVR